MPDNEVINPNLSSNVAQGGVADEAGGATYSGVAAESTSVPTFGGPTADFIIYGVADGGFTQGPPDSTANIKPVNNPLQYWYGPVQASGGAMTARWSLPDEGGFLTCSLAPGNATDEGYFEQIIPIGASSGGAGVGTRPYKVGHWVEVSLSGVTGTGTGKLWLDYLDPTLAALPGATQVTGTGTSRITALISSKTLDINDRDPGYLRIRFGPTRNGGGLSDTLSLTFTDVRVERAHLVGVITDITPSGTYSPGVISQATGVLSIRPNGAAGTPTLDMSAATGVTTLSSLLTLTAGQIAFPATANPSADANTLDDYEEGTWTPALTFGGAAVSMTFGARSGQYVKIGQLVYARCILNLTAKGSSTGTALLTGLPFTSHATDASSGGAMVYFANMATATDLMLRVDSNATTATFTIPGAAAHALATHANFTNTSVFNAYVTYQAAA